MFRSSEEEQVILSRNIKGTKELLLQSLRKIFPRTSKTSKISGNVDILDGWRGMAIVFVLLSHFLPFLKIVDFGRLGVDIFFVLSGLLMSNILFLKRVPLATFYKKRFSRVFPVFFVYVSVIYLFGHAVLDAPESTNYFFTLFFLRGYLPVSPDILHTGLPIGHIWSLNIEEHSYVVLSIVSLFYVFKGREYVPLFCLGIATFIVKLIYVENAHSLEFNDEIRTEVVASFILFSAGYFLIKSKFKALVPSFMPIITFFLAVCCYSDYVPWYAKSFFPPILLAFTVNHLEKLPHAFRQFLNNDYLKKAGILSFSLYLWQQPFYFTFVKFGGYSPYIGFIVLPMAIFTGYLSFKYIEQPLRIWINKNWA